MYLFRLLSRVECWSFHKGNLRWLFRTSSVCSLLLRAFLPFAAYTAQKMIWRRSIINVEDLWTDAVVDVRDAVVAFDWVSQEEGHGFWQENHASRIQRYLGRLLVMLELGSIFLLRILILISLEIIYFIIFSWWILLLLPYWLVFRLQSDVSWLYYLWSFLGLSFTLVWTFTFPALWRFVRMSWRELPRLPRRRLRTWSLTKHAFGSSPTVRTWLPISNRGLFLNLDE